MPGMLDDNIKGQVREMFSNLSRPVTILFFGSSQPERCQYCAETAQLLKEVCELSDQLSLEEYDIDADAGLAKQYKVDSVPEFVMVGRDGEKYIDYGIRAKGIPAGHEFSSLVNSLVLVSKGDSNLTSETKRFLGALTKPVHLQVFVTPT
jgi:alkyl hydroperoxide reductase subunit AhpF